MRVRSIALVVFWIAAAGVPLAAADGGQPPVMPFTYLFDTRQPAVDPPTAHAMASRNGWREVPEGNTIHRFRGDAVVVNNRIAVVVRRRAAGAETYARGPGGWQRLARVRPVPAGGRPVGAIEALGIKENTLSGVRLDCRYPSDAGSVTVGYRLTAGDPALEVHPGPGLKRVRIEADIRYAVVPNYFGDDLVFSADRVDGRQQPLPAEQILLAMLDDGDAMLMAVSESDRQRFRIALSGTASTRRVTAAEVEAAEGQRIWVALLADRGIWAAGRPSPDRPGLRWTPPFPARWRLARRRAGERTESTLYREQAVREATEADWLVYPLERDRQTPLARFCMTDVMRNTLGVGPCQYIIAAEGLNAETPHEVTEWVKKQFQRRRQTEAAGAIQDRLERMIQHIRQSQERIEAYRRVAAGLKAIGADRRAQHGVAREAAARIGQLAAWLEASIVIDDADLQPIGYGRRYADVIASAIGSPAAAAALEAPARELVRIGTAQDRSLANCRMVIKQLKIECAGWRERLPDAAPLLDRVEKCLAERPAEP